MADRPAQFAQKAAGVARELTRIVRKMRKSAKKWAGE